jgi:hypothetical protein
LLFIELVVDPVDEPFGEIDLFEVKLVHPLALWAKIGTKLRTSF